MNPAVSPYASISVVPSSQAAPGSIAEGSSVFVRVLAAEGGGRYTVSFAGRRFSVLSRQALGIGSAFRADVKVEKGQVLLVPRRLSPFSAAFPEGGSAGDAEGVRRFSSLHEVGGEKLSAFLEQLGLPFDDVSFRSVQFFQENGIRFDGRLALKARAIAKRFKGREEDAAEIALFLLQKGLEADENMVLYLLDILNGKQNSNENSSGSFSELAQNEGGSAGDFLPFVYENASKLLSLPFGLLSFLNHYKSEDKHWLVLPFEYCINSTCFNGVIRLFINLEEKKTEKMLISAFSSVRNYYFVISFKGKTNTDNKIRLIIDYCITHAVSNFEAMKLGGLLETSMAGIADLAVHYREDMCRFGCFTGAPDLSFAEARA